MDQEFDLREYVLVLLRHWRLIVSIMLIAAIVAGIVAAVRPPLYRATATLSVATGQFFWGFTTAIRTTLDPNADWRRTVIAEQLQSTELAELVLARVGDQLPEEQRDPEVLVEQVRGRLVENSLTGYEVIVEDRNPRTAALLANTWAEVLSERMENLYGLGELRKALAEAEKQLADVDRRIEEYNALTGGRLAMGGDIAAAGGETGPVYSGLPASRLHLVYKNAALAEYRESIDRLRLVLKHARAAAAERRGLVGVPLELLNTSILNARGLKPTELAAAYGDNLPRLITLLDTHLAEMEQVEADLWQEVLAMQGHIAQEQTTFQQLDREQQIASETVMQLNRQVQEVQAQRLVEGPLVSVIRAAEVPERPAGLPLVAILVLGAFLGALVGILLALAWEALHVRVAVRQPAPSPG